MKDIIMTIINDWDPIGLFPMAPTDEYISEIEKIQEVLKSNNYMTIGQLAFEINNIFLKTFGDEVYTKSLNECKKIAAEIINKVDEK
ncbi:hypothetical protein B0P06_000427 [Clostridium saccharoperbutylacetonicum]|uniref:DUF1871 domain-containing protein n=1 Tax=Clostridium saccharoperbutylacetonicum N1-4(HMT) TaxID=931276 RepID=M1MVD4_9CLOT|nr:DUF1871 family protein [Clostridium saccharoperbutylacetonicum]AGF55477.1 hypothetical protein DUF1871 [Clostridium saccharoperbutylacetonicum N1-4(HMT)]NRT63806.1 hypothetical protein [Clostridium saccharoperbutylacetonicum]NSB27169.1 hypothetical protein [Clostridium saccharoperbutylacetonicum]NSB40656.1 hypothetical protein [Clostridium saccharoperbutylacetonicum]